MFNFSIKKRNQPSPLLDERYQNRKKDRAGEMENFHKLENEDPKKLELDMKLIPLLEDNCRFLPREQYFSKFKTYLISSFAGSTYLRKMDVNNEFLYAMANFNDCCKDALSNENLLDGLDKDYAELNPCEDIFIRLGAFYMRRKGRCPEQVKDLVEYILGFMREYYMGYKDSGSSIFEEFDKYICGDA